MTEYVVFRKSDTPSLVPLPSKLDEGDLAFNTHDQRVFTKFGEDVVELTSENTAYSSSDFDSDFSGKSTSDLSEGSNLYFTEQRARDSISASGDLSYDSNSGMFSVTTYKYSDFTSDFNSKTTSDLSEGTNLYFTEQRVRDSLSASGDLTYSPSSGGFSVTTYKSSDFNTDFSAKTTDDLTEGSSLYFTEQRARDSISVSGDLSYSGGVISFSETYSSASQVKDAYESNPDTNSFDDNLKSKLEGIESGATRDQTKNDIDALEIDARTLQGKSAEDFDSSGAADAVRREVDEKLRKRPDPLLMYFL